MFCATECVCVCVCVPLRWPPDGLESRSQIALGSARRGCAEMGLRAHLYLRRLLASGPIRYSACEVSSAEGPPLQPLSISGWTPAFGRGGRAPCSQPPPSSLPTTDKGDPLGPCLGSWWSCSPPPGPTEAKKPSGSCWPVRLSRPGPLGFCGENCQRNITQSAWSCTGRRSGSSRIHKTPRGVQGNRLNGIVSLSQPRRAPGGDSGAAPVFHKRLLC